MPDDNTNKPNDPNNDNLNHDDPHRPWTMAARERSTRTANVYDIQRQLIDINKPPINRNDIPEALHKRNLLRQTKVIQISPNIKYISIQFDTSTIMETFRPETLEIKDQFSMLFQPDFRKRQRPPINYTHISFQNVPTEADEDAMTEFVEDHAIVVGHPRYPRKNLDGIEYLTGKRVYRVHTIRHHISRLIKLVGRQIKCIYHGQPEQNTRQPNGHSSSETLTDQPESETETESQTQTETQPETNQNLQQDKETNHNQNSKKKNKQNTNDTENKQNNNKSEEQPIRERQVNQHLQQNSRKTLTNEKTLPSEKTNENKHKMKKTTG